jgi:Tetratricopeptide repeat
MKSLFTTLLFSFLIQFLFAQVPSQAEINKMMKQAQDVVKKYSKDSTVNKAMTDALGDKKEALGKMKNIPVKNIMLPLSKNDSTQFTVPFKNTKLLNALPIRTFNKAELVSYIHNLQHKLTEYLRNTYTTDISNISSTAISSSGTCVGLWMKGKVNEAVLVSLKTAALNPDNNVRLNNTGGILTSCGMAFYGIPILNYVLQKQPENNVILNNLGQAYLDLGDDKSAETYLLKCIKSYKYYPDANLALAFIAKSRGQKSAAISYAENSLRGAYSAKAHVFLKALKPDIKMMDYVRHRYKMPIYFDVGKYHMLPQCIHTSTVYELEPQYVAYQEMLDKLGEKTSAQMRVAAIAGATSVQEKIMNVNQTKKNPYRPFGTFGNVVLQALKEEYQEKFKVLNAFRKSYSSQRIALNEKYEIELKQLRDRQSKIEQLSTEQRCKELDALSNAYLPLYAEPTEQLQRKTLNYYKSYFNDMAYWSYVASVNDDQFNIMYNALLVELIGTLKSITTTRFMESKYGSQRFYPCAKEKTTKAKADTLMIEVPDCYINPKIEFDLGAFAMEVSCETYKLEAGEGLVGKIEFDRASGNTTLAFGVGADVPMLSFKGAGLNAGIEAEAKSQLYITFDNKGTPTDLGVLWEAEIKAVLEGGSVKGSIGLEEGLTAGFGSGVQMKENSLSKQAIDKIFPVQPDDNQQNKNVPLYKK